MGPVAAALEHIRAAQIRHVLAHRRDGIAAPKHVESEIATSADEQGRLFDLARLISTQILEVALMVTISADGAVKT